VHDSMTSMVQGMGTNHPLCSVGLSTVTTALTFQISMEVTAAGNALQKVIFYRSVCCLLFVQRRGEYVSLLRTTLQRRIGDISTNLSGQSKQRVNSASTASKH